MSRHYQLKAASPPARALNYQGLLNDQQIAVVEAGDGPILVIAGAGSGKTRTLTWRVARLVADGVAPEGILLLTFTNKAAREMLRRVEEVCRVDTRRISGGTFHHVAHEVLREHAAELGYQRGYSILDREDSRDVMTAAIAECGLAVGARRFPKADVLIDLVSMAVNTQTPLADVLADRRPQFVPLTDDVLRVARRYAERKHALNAMDFDDLLLNWKILLAEREHVRRALAGRYRHVLVDEYQDTNRLQGDVVDLIAAEHRNLCVVGDDAQSIYSFRGAHFANILEFEKRYPDARRFDLTVNYRSTPQILSLANASIAANVRQFKKELSSVRRDGTLPAVVPCRDVQQQAAFVAQRVLELRDEGIPLPEIAVLYRAHHHSMEIQFELARRGIPFVVRSGVRFFEAAHVKDVLAHLRFARNPGDELALKRCLKITPGVGTATADAVWSAFSLRRSRGRGTLDELLAPDVASHVPAKGRAGYTRLAQLLRALGRPPTSDLPGEAIEKVLDGGYEEYLRAEFLNADQRVEDVQQLAQYARGYEDTEAFLSEIALLTEISAETVSEGGEPDEKMILSSVHQAKGLEWRAVFVVWLADGRFPSAQALKDTDGEEEERRLFYVASTRAKDELYLTYPVVAAPRDRERVVMKASRFLEELPAEPELFERWQLDDPGLPAALGAAPPPAAGLPPRDPSVVPALFGEPAPRRGPADVVAPVEADGGDPGGGDDVPF
ncbi:UvrD/REP helicase [Anaeromyxobacter dehalogenans 2CP-1]|uniref:DNA 3'-5' helicase n=1 Tax=Anaeromyxobacter dehalogenans (strain ATCC BAA-258 / DSM 21875 / 2CP-1) TaxID=455488 RepID=B8J956_ANAD2|nr:ATP-dependent helicase [Anaeromyxobacter dehalogenans]ACL65462.1 UvrD/REP helicase [Anaeromyxobacter dehalogenans 2CP-1]